MSAHQQSQVPLALVQTNRPMSWLHYVRSAELKAAWPFLVGSSGSLLEFGGGDGYLASILSSYFHDVHSVDVNPDPTYYKVTYGDAENIWFTSNSFDVVFSCHVLAHIKDKAAALSEVHRVLTQDGVAIHVVPSPWWSILTNLIHVAMLPKYVASYVVRKIMHKPTDSLKATILHPLGTAPSFVHEVFQFRKKQWWQLLTDAGFQCTVFDGPLLQSGYRLFPFKAIRLRRWLANYMPSSYILVTKKGK